MSVQQMICHFITGVMLVSSASAQTPDMPAMRKNIDILSGVLLDSLELTGNPNPFGINAGQVKGIYLQNQGVLFEIQSPLASRRNRVSLGSLATALQEMNSRDNPFDLVGLTSRSSAADRAAPGASAAFADTGSNTDFEEILGSGDSFEYEIMISNAIREASQWARALRELDYFDQNAWQEFRSDMEQVRDRVRQQTSELDRQQSALRQTLTTPADDISVDSINQARAGIDNLRSRLSGLHEDMESQARQLQDQYQAAQQQYEQDWLEEVDQMEVSIYGVLCEYGNTLRTLPEGQYVTVVLTGLGVETDGTDRPDKIHTISRQQLLECQSGAIDAVALRRLSSEYSY